MASFWEIVAERAGYAIGAAIFGPGAALARRERRALRRAFHDWLDELDAERLPPRGKGMSRRSGSLRGAEPVPFEAELDPFEKRARVDVALALGRDVTAEASKARWVLEGVMYRLASPFAAARMVRVDKTSLDRDAAKELADEIDSAFARLETFALDLRKDRVVLEIVAPRDTGTWIAIEKGLVVLVESWTRRWTTYR